MNANRLSRSLERRRSNCRLSDQPHGEIGELTDEQLKFVMFEVEKRRLTTEQVRHYERAMLATTPKVAAPEMDDPQADVRLMFTLPEMQAFWRKWQGPTRGADGRERRGPKPSHAAAKAVMCVMAITGVSPHLDDNNRLLGRDSELLTAFNTLEQLAQGVRNPTFPGLGPTAGKLELPAYNTISRLFKDIAPAGILAAQEARMEMIKALRALRPDAGIGEVLTLDGTDVPAWTQQKGGGGRGSERDLELRRHTPQAGYRSYMRERGGGKRAVGAEDTARRALAQGKDWRGYYKTPLNCQACSLPTVLNVFDAATDEAQTLVPLLSDLYRLWPDTPTRIIVADAAWDEDWAYRLCEVNYGIHLIARQKEGKGEYLLAPGASRDGSVRAITHAGQLICGRCKLRLDHVTFSAPSRAGLDPGQEAPGASSACVPTARTAGGSACAR